VRFPRRASHLAPGQRLGKEGCRISLPKKDAGTGDPSWRQSLRGKASGTYRCAAACARRLLCCCRLFGCLASKIAICAANWGPLALGPWGTPQTNPQISWASLIPSPSLFSSAPSTPLAHPQASLAKSTLRAPHPTLNTRRIRSVILSETLTSKISSHPSLNQHSCSFFAETTLHDYFKHTLVSNLEFTKIRIRL
jgi:hypothetical protein